MRPHLTTHLRSALALIMIASMAAALAACQPRPREHDPWVSDGVDLNVRTSDRSVLAGQVVVLNAEVNNTLGRDVRIEWDAAGGEVTTDHGGRVARVQYDRPGTYVVVARLFVDDELHRTESTRVSVRRVH